MKVTLRNVKIHDDISWMSRCFSATICVDDKPIGRAISFGTSEPIQYRWTNLEQASLLEDWVESQTPEGTHEEFADDDENFDIYIETLIAAHELRVRYSREMTTKTLYMLKGDEAGAYYKHQHIYLPEVAEYIRKRHGDKLELIINEDIEAAIQLTLRAEDAERKDECEAMNKLPYCPSTGWD